jgi:hypothetical protein
LRNKLLYHSYILGYTFISISIYLYKAQGSYWAGLFMLGSSLKSFWIPSKRVLIEIFGFQSSSSFKILKQTVPEGYTLGWGSTGLNWPIQIFNKYPSFQVTFWRLDWVVRREFHCKFIDTAVPRALWHLKKKSEQ